MRKVGNSYSAIERIFARRIGGKLCDLTPELNGDGGPGGSPAAFMGITEKLSVVVCTYNGGRTLPLLLAALERQRHRDFEVVVVDDGSDRPVEPLVRAAALSVPVTLVRSRRNRGVATARNLGLMVAGGDSVVFLDDDMRPPLTMTGSLALRQTHAAGCVFVGFREDVSAERFFADDPKPPRAERDWRCHSKRGPGEYLFLAADQNAPRVHRSEFSTVRDTDYFKALGNGRVFEFWDLPGLMSGHSVCLKRADAVAAGGFAEGYFRGWGAEDLAFGAVLAARGHYVVPALDWVSLHLRQEGRHAGGRAVERESLRRNFARYLSYIGEPLGWRRLPAHWLRPTGRAVGGVETYEVRN
jgi:glycosyltransferase involved in cell wall biosynthesis